MGDFWAIAGWIVAVLSLGVNVLQLLKSNEAKKKNHTNPSQKRSPGAVQQVHSGKGDNIVTDKKPRKK